MFKEPNMKQREKPVPKHQTGTPLEVEDMKKGGLIFCFWEGRLCSPLGRHLAMLDKLMDKAEPVLLLVPNLEPSRKPFLFLGGVLWLLVGS